MQEDLYCPRCGHPEKVHRFLFPLEPDQCSQCPGGICKEEK